MSRTKLDTKTPAELKKELAKALKNVEELTSSLEAKNETIEGLEQEKKEHIGLIKKHKALAKIFKGELVEYKQQRSALMVAVVEMKNTNELHAAQIADKVLSDCTPLRYYINKDMEQIIESTPLYDNAAPASIIRKLFNS